MKFEAPTSRSGMRDAIGTVSESLGFREQRGLPEFLETLRWRWKTIVILASLLLAGAVPYIESLPPKYDGRAVVAIEPRANVPTSGADTVRVVGPKYAEYATAASTLSRVSPRVAVSLNKLEHAVSASLQADAATLTITARLGSATLAARVANEVAAEVISFSGSDPLLFGQVVARALPARSPAAPPRRLLEAAAAVVAVLCGVFVSLLLERGKPRIRSRQDLARFVGYPVVGTLPRSWTLHGDLRKAFRDPSVSAAIRSLRANLQPRFEDGTLDTIAVTSPALGDGKTSVAALLAEAVARTGVRVLLVDSDMRHPSLADAAAANSHPGLAGILTGTASLDDEIRDGWIDGLFLLPTRAHPDAGDLLLPRRIESVLQDARSRFDFLVLDLPPLLGTDDARIVARFVKGVLLVVSAGRTATDVNDAIFALENLRAPLLGVVANRMPGDPPYY